MARYKKVNEHWRESKALGYFRNFIQNHSGTINNNETFQLVAALRTQTEWQKLIHACFPVIMLERMEDHSCSGNRLDALRRQYRHNQGNPCDYPDFSNGTEAVLRELWCVEFARDKARTMLLKVIDEELTAHPAANYAEEAFALRVKELQNTLKLSDQELDVLLVLAFEHNGLLCIADGHDRRSDEHDKAVFVAKCLDCDISEVMTALAEKNKLRRYCCVDNDFDFNHGLFYFLNGVSQEPISDNYYHRCSDEVLPWDFYGALAEKHGTLLKRIIAAGNGTAPTNILLYGAPGTGKTSFAKTLAAELHRKCFLIQQSVDTNRGPACSAPRFRFGALQICAEQIDPSDSLVIVDEADEMLRGNDFGAFAMLFGGGNSTAGDKGLLNSVLDTVKVPTIWITNTPAGALDESSRRRFDYSIRFELLSAPQRQAIWRNNVAKMNLGSLISETQMERYAALYPVSAGGITLVLQNLVKLAPAAEEVDGLVQKLMAPHCELLQIPEQQLNAMLPAADYSLEGLNIHGQLKLEQIVAAIRNFQNDTGKSPDRPRMNLLLSGAPGTGKTEFVKYLGSVLNTKVVVKMGSDLLNMYVGGTEQRIKAAFAEAEAEKAILFLDEIDGMLQSRERAQRSWEVTQVNELLHQMENFKGVMIGATNFSANLDQAVLRRFTFKLEFDYLDEAGKKLFFERMFQTTLTQKELAALAAVPNLAPGDFRTVRQSFYYLGSEVNNQDRIDALARESEAKKAASIENTQKIGFSA